MALPQVHYYLGKPTQHMPRQWNFPVGLAASRHCNALHCNALCQLIQIGYIDIYINTTLGFDKYLIRNCEKSYASFMLTLVSTRQSSVPGYSGPARSGRIQLIERSFGMLVFRRVGV